MIAAIAPYSALIVAGDRPAAVLCRATTNRSQTLAQEPKTFAEFAARLVATDKDVAGAGERRM